MDKDSITTRLEAHSRREREQSLRDPDIELLIDTTIKAFQGALEASITSINRRLDDMSIRHTNELTEMKMCHNQQLLDLEKDLKRRVDTEIGELRTSFEFTQSQLDNISRECRDSSKELRPADQEHSQQISAINQQLHQVEIKLDYPENQTCHNNLRFDGIPEDAREEWSTTEQKLAQAITRELGLPAPTIERAHHIGRPQSTPGKPHTIVAKLANFKECKSVLLKAKQIRDKSFITYQDFSARVTKRRQELIPKLQDVCRQGHKAFIIPDPIEGSKLIQKPASGGNRQVWRQGRPISDHTPAPTNIGENPNQGQDHTTPKTLLADNEATPTNHRIPRDDIDSASTNPESLYGEQADGAPQIHQSSEAHNILDDNTSNGAEE